MDELCAIYVRVSTDIQDYERQKADLTNKATELNLKIPDDAIFEDKLSGFKDETQRIGLKNLKEYCLKNRIKKVLVWEISRLARKQLTLLELKEFFQTNGINVYFLNQGLWLLDKNGLVDSQVSMYITVTGWFGEYEAKLMFERFRSQKVLNESIGKYNGGKIPFGYKLSKDNYYIPNDEIIEGLNISESDIVKEVFNLYQKGNVCSKICRLCRSKNYPKIVCNTHTLARLLRDTTYIGSKTTKLGNRATPPLISLSQFNDVKGLIDQNKTKADKGNKHIYLLRGIIKCSYCGSFYVGKQTDDGYICPKNSGSNKTNKNTSCEGGNISISNLDGIVWQRAKSWLVKWKVEGFDDEMIGFKSNIQDLNNQILRYQDSVSQCDKDRAKINLMFRNDGYSPEEYKREIDKNKKERENLNHEIALLQSQISLLERQNEEYKSFNSRIREINSISDRNQMKLIIKALIKEIVFYKVDLFKTVLFIHYYKTDTPECIIYNSVAKKGNKFRLIKPQYFRFDINTKIFFAIKDAQSVFKQAETKILKKNGVKEEIPEYIPAIDFANLADKYNLNHLKIERLIYYPIPDETNSVIMDFDAMMTFPDLEGFVKTFEYNKMEYFKNINRDRFKRKKSKPNLQ